MYQSCRLPVTQSMVGLIVAMSCAGAGLWSHAAYAGEVGATPSAPVSATAAERRSAAYQRMLRLLDEDRPADAVPAAFEVVELTRELEGDDNAALLTPLTNLATAQLRAGDLLAAGNNYSAAVTLVEKHEGIVSPQLVTPLMGLGRTYMQAGQFVQATESFERALHVNHVNQGFYNLDQLPVHDALTESYLGQKDFEKANFHQESQLQIMAHRLGKESPELLPALSRLGDWYEQTGQVLSARLVRQDMVRRIAATGGENDPAMVEPLIAIASSYRQQALQSPVADPMQEPETLFPMSSVVLRKALNIVDQQPEPDPVQRARVLVEFGDLYRIWGKRNSSGEAYDEAWQTLSGDKKYAVQRDGFFARPMRLFWNPPPRIYPASARNLPPGSKLESGYVVVRYSVDAMGRVSSAEVMESDPAGLIDQSVLNAVRRSLYRPRYVDGAAAPAEGLSLRHEFSYRIEPEAAPPPDVPDSGRPLSQPDSDSRN